ncbi:glycosyltransferase family 39 protein [Chloroflexia bacterium SDU3-3]|nr:glycosyltransferase family 39 protein [Chloroflexia bacterium SDU3-3]
MKQPKPSSPPTDGQAGSRVHLFVLGGIALGVVLRLLYILLVPTTPGVFDSVYYMRTSASIAAGLGYRIDGHLTNTWPIGYPAMLATIFMATGPSVLAAKLINIALAAMSMWFSYRIAVQIFRSRYVGLLTVLLMACYANQIAYSAEVMSESLFLCCSLASCYLMLAQGGSPWKLALAGVMCGVTTMVKPQFLFIPLALLVFEHMARPAPRPPLRILARSLGILALTIALIMVPWIVRNYRITGHVQLVSGNSGLTLFLSTSPVVTRGELDGMAVPREIMDTYGRMMNTNEYEADRWLRDQAIDAIKTQPIATAGRMLSQAWYLWKGDVDGIRLNEQNLDFAQLGFSRESYPTSTLRYALLGLKLAAACFYVLILLLAGMALVSAVRHGQWRDPLLWFGVFTALYYSAVAVVFHGESRYHLPAMPWLVMYSAAALAALTSGQARRIYARLSAGAAA